MQKGPRGGGTPGLSRKSHTELEAEVDDLRERLHMQNRMSMDEWLLNPPEVRDQIAARVLYQEYGRISYALTRLGFIGLSDTGGIRKEDTSLFETAKSIFETPGCQEHILRHLKKVEENQEQIVARMQQVALNAEDSNAVRAASILSKMQGWQKTPDTVIDNRRINLVQLLGNERDPESLPLEALQGPVDAATFLNHEPGGPTRISIDSSDDLFMEP